MYIQGQFQHDEDWLTLQWTRDNVNPTPQSNAQYNCLHFFNCDGCSAGVELTKKQVLKFIIMSLHYMLAFTIISTSTTGSLSADFQPRLVGNPVLWRPDHCHNPSFPQLHHVALQISYFPIKYVWQNPSFQYPIIPSLAFLGLLSKISASSNF